MIKPKYIAAFILAFGYLSIPVFAQVNVTVVGSGTDKGKFQNPLVVSANSGTGSNQFANGATTTEALSLKVSSTNGVLVSGTATNLTLSGTVFDADGIPLFNATGGGFRQYYDGEGTLSVDMGGRELRGNWLIDAYPILNELTGVLATSGSATGLTLSGTTVLNGVISGTAVIPGVNLQASGTGNAGAITTGAQSIAGAKTFTDNITANGAANTMPNQTAAGGSYVMTRDLGDDRYFGTGAILSSANTLVVTNSSSLTDVPGLAIPLSTGRWQVDFNATASQTSAGSGGSKIAIAYTGSATGVGNAFYASQASTSAVSFNSTIQLGEIAYTVSPLIIRSEASNACWVKGTIYIVATTSGTLTVQMAQNSATPGQSINARQGSSLVVRKMNP